MKISFELEPADVERFREALTRTRDAVRSADDGDIVESAKHTLDGLLLGDAPTYVRDRIKQVQRLITMLEDDAWALPRHHRDEVITALVYFSDPHDMISDALPVIGMLDDAIMLELFLRQEADLLRAYDRFCEYRRTLGAVPDVLAARTEWCAALSRRRGQLLSRLDASRRRREAV
ncbi:MAG: DUF1232 domain-containing protein [Xanthomonadaceae bacterium]|nr:DUF1232 domain-containing protein [Xanthomonadaceae bacterium]